MLKSANMLNAEFQFELSPMCRSSATRETMLDGRRLEVSPVFDTYWHFACRRQDAYFRRLDRQWPFTSDPILSEFKFTNAYRASDRTSQYLIRNVIYADDQPLSAEDLFFRILLFKFFNKIETWELLCSRLGEISFKSYRFDVYDSIFNEALERKNRIYSAAYIMPSGGPSGEARKHKTHLRLLERMMEDKLPVQIARCKNMKQAFSLLRAYPTLGDFLSYQFVTDLNYSELCDFTESEFVAAGPGAHDGLRKCFPRSARDESSRLIRLMYDMQEQCFAELGLTFRSLWGRKLQLIDCQNLFCEVDKYSRVAHPEIEGISGRTRIKQLFRPRGDMPPPFFPPKWGINDSIIADASGGNRHYAAGRPTNANVLAIRSH
jgi:alpha-glutamyl/putrescinyl thymine pyrophosphorylase clade 1